MIIEVSESVRLRRFDPDAAGSGLLQTLLGWYRDPDTVRMVDGPNAAPYDLDKLLAMFRHLRDTGELYLIEEQVAGSWEPIGDVTLQQYGIPILLCPTARGRGIGGRVLRSLILYASRAGRSELLVTEVYAYNEAARRLFTAAGFEPVAETELGNRYRLGLADG